MKQTDRGHLKFPFLFPEIKPVNIQSGLEPKLQAPPPHPSRRRASTVIKDMNLTQHRDEALICTQLPIISHTRARLWVSTGMEMRRPAACWQDQSMRDTLERIGRWWRQLSEEEQELSSTPPPPTPPMWSQETQTWLYLSRCGGNILQPLGTSSAAWGEERGAGLHSEQSSDSHHHQNIWHETGYRTSRDRCHGSWLVLRMWTEVLTDWFRLECDCGRAGNLQDWCLSKGPSGSLRVTGLRDWCLSWFQGPWDNLSHVPCPVTVHLGRLLEYSFRCALTLVCIDSFRCQLLEYLC